MKNYIIMCVKHIIVLLETISILVGGYMILVLNNANEFRWSIWTIGITLFGIGLTKIIPTIKITHAFYMYTYYKIKLNKLLKKGGNTL